MRRERRRRKKERSMNMTENRELKDEERAKIFKKILCTLLNFGRRNRGLASNSKSASHVYKILYTTQSKTIIENKKKRERERERAPQCSPPMNER